VRQVGKTVTHTTSLVAVTVALAGAIAAAALG
jgi:hypothetical protein